MKDRKEIDARELSHKDLILAFDELSDDYTMLEAEYLDYSREVVELTVLMKPFLQAGMAKHKGISPKDNNRLIERINVMQEKLAKIK